MGASGEATVKKVSGITCRQPYDALVWRWQVRDGSSWMYAFTGRALYRGETIVRYQVPSLAWAVHYSIGYDEACRHLEVRQP